MIRFGKIKVAKEKFYSAEKPIKSWNVDADNIVISKLVETKNSSKYLNGYLDHVIRLLALLLSKMSGYVKTFKDKCGDKNKNNKLMSLPIYDNKLLEKYKTIWTKIKDLKNIESDALPIYDSILKPHKNIW